MATVRDVPVRPSRACGVCQPRQIALRARISPSQAGHRGRRLVSLRGRGQRRAANRRQASHRSPASRHRQRKIPVPYRHRRPRMRRTSCRRCPRDLRERLTRPRVDTTWAPTTEFVDSAQRANQQHPGLTIGGKSCPTNDSMSAAIEMGARSVDSVSRGGFLNRATASARRSMAAATAQSAAASAPVAVASPPPRRCSGEPLAVVDWAGGSPGEPCGLAWRPGAEGSTCSSRAGPPSDQRSHSCGSPSTWCTCAPCSASWP